MSILVLKVFNPEQRWNLPLRDLWVITHLSTHEENTAHHFSLFVCLSVRAYVYPGGVIAGHCLVAYRVARSRQSSECIHARDGSECVCVEFVDRAVVHRNGQWKSRRTWPDPGYNGKQTANTEGERGRDERKETEREIRGLVRGAADSFYVRRRERQEKCLSKYMKGWEEEEKTFGGGEMSKSSGPACVFPWPWSPCFD